MRDRVKEVINFILPLPIGIEVYVKSAYCGRWLRGKIVDRLYSKRVGWYYVVKMRETHGSRFVTIDEIRPLEKGEKEGYEKGRERNKETNR